MRVYKKSWKKPLCYNLNQDDLKEKIKVCAASGGSGGNAPGELGVLSFGPILFGK